MTMAQKELSIEDILGDFDVTKPVTNSGLTGGTVTIWLSSEDKARYDRLQERSGRKFSKKAREVLIALIDIAESRAS